MHGCAARIELNGPPEGAVYNEVHQRLSSIGWKREIKGESGRWWKLPDAMYVGVSNESDVSQIQEWLTSTVDEVWPRNEVIVFRHDDAAWQGLTQLRA